jgi:DNA-binding transcriptional MerR regulator
MNRFSIRDLENLTGIKAHTIRIWEQRYDILQPKRTPTNIRYYDADDLKLALRVALLNQYGYKISRIHRMKSEEMATLIETITDPNFRFQADAIRMLDATLAMDTGTLERLLAAQIDEYGMEQTIENLRFSFWRRSGSCGLLIASRPRRTPGYTRHPAQDCRSHRRSANAGARRSGRTALSA